MFLPHDFRLLKTICILEATKGFGAEVVKVTQTDPATSAVLNNTT